jgi:hypothetical protein
VQPDLLGQLMAACQRENITRILIDCREASSQATVLEVWLLARDFAALGVTYKYRVAVLNRPKDDFFSHSAHLGLESNFLCYTSTGRCTLVQ